MDTKEEDKKLNWEEITDTYHRQKMTDIKEVQMEKRREKDLAEAPAQMNRTKQS